MNAQERTTTHDFKSSIKELSDLSKANPPITVNHENDFLENNKHELADRDKVYTIFLRDFTTLYTNRQRSKEKKKWEFFDLIKVLFTYSIVFIFICLVVICIRVDPSKISDTAPVFISAIVGLITILISIPTIITKYLFNPDEDKDITTMVIEMQKRDMDNRNAMFDYQKNDIKGRDCNGSVPKTTNTE